MKRSDFKELRLLIGIPSRGDFKSDFALNLAFMTHILTARPLVKIDGETHFIQWYLHCVKTSNLSQSRQNIVDLALQNEFHFMLFIDDDMVFEPAFVLEWLAENRPVMAMNCPTRSVPCYPTARQFDPAEPFKGSLVYSDNATSRFERVWRVGTGVMLLRADALRSLPRPAFTPRWEDGNNAYVGEDWRMCEHLQEAGFPILVDHEHSLHIKHVGDVEYTHEMAVGTRKAIERQRGGTESGIIIPQV